MQVLGSDSIQKQLESQGSPAQTKCDFVTISILQPVKSWCLDCILHSIGHEIILLSHLSSFLPYCIAAIYLRLPTSISLTCTSYFNFIELAVGHQPWPHSRCLDPSLTPQSLLSLTMSVAPLLIVLLALLSPTQILSPLAQAPCSFVNAVIVLRNHCLIVMRSHCLSASPVPHSMSLAVVAQWCVSLSLSKSNLALKLLVSSIIALFQLWIQ